MIKCMFKCIIYDCNAQQLRRVKNMLRKWLKCTIFSGLNAQFNKPLNKYIHNTFHMIYVVKCHGIRVEPQQESQYDEGFFPHLRCEI